MESRVDRLNFTQSVFYGLVHVERILHLYKLVEEEVKDATNIFFDIHKDGYQMLRDEVDKIYEYLLLDEKILTKYAEENTDNIMLRIIDSDDCSGYYSNMALPIVAGVCYLCDYIVERNVQNIIYCHDMVISCFEIISWIIEDERGLDESGLDELYNRMVASEQIVDDELIELIERLIVEGSPYKIDELKSFAIKHRVDIGNY